MDANLFSKCIERVEQDVKAALADMEPHPYISIGGAKTQQPFEVLVREIATDYSIEDVVTNTYMGASDLHNGLPSRSRYHSHGRCQSRPGAFPDI